MDLLQLYHLRMDKCASEQFWLLGLITPVYGFLILKSEAFRKCLSLRTLKALPVLATVLCCGFILSRQIIYLRYDALANQIIIRQASQAGLSLPSTSGFWKQVALWSGSAFNCLIAVTLMAIAWRALFKIPASIGMEANPPRGTALNPQILPPVSRQPIPETKVGILDS
jgi:hypothetical protein